MRSSRYLLAMGLLGAGFGCSKAGSTSVEPGALAKSPPPVTASTGPARKVVIDEKVNPPGGTLKGPATYATLRPFFQAHCLKCHGDRPQKAGGYDLSSYSGALNSGDDKGAIKPGDPAASTLIQLITSPTRDRMPRGGGPVQAGDVKVIADWIKDGAKEK